jgi:hypothetical protein
MLTFIRTFLIWDVATGLVSVSTLISLFLMPIPGNRSEHIEIEISCIYGTVNVVRKLTQRLLMG